MSITKLANTVLILKCLSESKRNKFSVGENKHKFLEVYSSTGQTNYLL